MSASAELQKLIYDTLIADAGVGALVGDKVFDGRPETAAFPCITFGPADFVQDDAHCIIGRVETVQLDVWARDDGHLWPCKRIVDAVKAALHLAPLELTVNALVQLRVIAARVRLDPDGITAHGVVTLEAMVEEN